MINENSIQFNVVSKGLGCERMSFYLSEAAGEIRDVMLPTLEQPKAKLKPSGYYIPVDKRGFNAGSSEF